MRTCIFAPWAADTVGLDDQTLSRIVSGRASCLACYYGSYYKYGILHSAA